MTVKEFIAKLEEDVVFVPSGTLTKETVLEELDDWDSMATVAIIALADEYLGIQLNGEQIASCKTVDDLIKLMGHKLED